MAHPPPRWLEFARTIQYFSVTIYPRGSDIKHVMSKNVLVISANPRSLEVRCDQKEQGLSALMPTHEMIGARYHISYGQANCRELCIPERSGDHCFCDIAANSSELYTIL